MADDKKDKRILTPEFRLCFPALLEPAERSKKFEFKAVWPKGTDLAELKKSLLREVQAKDPELFAKMLEAFKKFWPSVPEKISGYGQPFRDGDEKKWDGFKDSVYLTVKTKYKPTVVNRKIEPIIDPTEIYAGMYCFASIEPYAYPARDGGSPGFAFGLRNVMKSRDGEPLSGGQSAEDDFATLKEVSKGNAADNDMAGLE